MLSHWNNSRSQKCLPSRTQYPDSEPTNHCFFSPLCCLLGGKATNTNFIVFGLIRPRVEPMIYSTWGEHANHYNTDVVSLLMMYNYYSYLVICLYVHCLWYIFVDSPSITTENFVLIVVGSVGVLALVTGICVCVAYTYSLQNRWVCYL